MHERYGDQNPGCNLKPSDGKTPKVEEENGDFEKDLDKDVEEFHDEKDLTFREPVNEIWTVGFCSLWRS